MIIMIDRFSGMSEAVSPRLLNENYAVSAVNCRLGSGALEPLRATSVVTAALGAYDTIARYYDNFWFTFSGDVDLARSPIAYDTTERIYWTGETYPRQTRADIATTVAPYPSNDYRLGVPVPGVIAPSVTGAPDPEQAGLENSVYYVVCAVTAWGEEGPPSDPTGPSVITDGQEVTLTLPSVPTGAYNFGVGAKWRIYRSNSGTASTAFQYLADVAMGTAQFLDTVSSSALGEVIPSTLWDAPPDDDAGRYPSGQMLGLKALANGVMVGFSGNTLVYSEPYLPHAWANSYPINNTIVSLSVTSQGVLVGTTGKPVLAVGLDPRAISLQELDEDRACVSKRSMVDMGEFAIYASQDGLIGFENGSLSLLTSALFTREQWQRFNPASIHAYRWEGGYVAFYDNAGTQGGFIFRPGDQEAGFIELDFYARAGYYDSEQDQLYLVVGTDLVTFDTGAAQTFSWTSKVFQPPVPVSMSALQVHAESFPVSVTITRDGVDEVYSVANDSPMRIAAGRNKTLQLKIESSATVYDIALSDSIMELANG